MSKLNFSIEQAKELSKNHRVIPIVETLFSGSETPLSIFEKLAADKPGSFLLESAQQGVWDRYSYIGVHNRGFLLQSASGSVSWNSSSQALPSRSEQLPGSGLDAVARLQAAWNTPIASELPPLTSGLVGLLSWDLIREIENLAPAKSADYSAPIVALAMFRDLVIVDHETSSVLLISNIFVEDDADLDSLYGLAVRNIDSMRKGLLQPIEAVIADLDLSVPVEAVSKTTKSDFLASVEKAKEYVRAGDVFQVVLSQRFESACTADALDVYRVLRALNPSPYMYLLNFDDEAGEFAIVGSSPEALVTVKDKHAVMHPIAGSRPRGKDHESDLKHELALTGDAKEKAEHLMLVDLARNDLLKVCEPTSVSVTEFMQVHRFSHIMHLVSTVEGEVRAHTSAIDVLRATFPAGTLSGAPKPRALEIIDELEFRNRGIFGGVVGYFDFADNANLAIAIRTAFIRDGIAHVQAGAGLVLDSDPESEYQETVTKASATLKAVAAANAMVRRKA